jgi:ubiquinone/menaquinone biosynthesis C-methylase UbiE
MSAQNVSAWLIVLRYSVALVIGFYVLNQVRKPSRWLGRPFAWMMNLSHSRLTDWGLQHTRIEMDFRTLDVGCGGGRTLQKLAALAPQGKVCGVDHAKGSVAASRAKNRESIAAGMMTVEQASVSQLPFAENAFDLVTAIETQYYWPDLVNDMREILRVLKPGGTLLVIAESYKKGAHQLLQGPAMKLLRSANLGVDEHRALFNDAGYADVQVFEERSKGWICVAGKKTLSPSN